VQLKDKWRNLVCARPHFLAGWHARDALPAWLAAGACRARHRRAHNAVCADACPPPARVMRALRPRAVVAAKVKFQHVGRDEAGRAPVRSFRGGYRRRLGRAPKPEGGEECVCTRTLRLAARAAPGCGSCRRSVPTGCALRFLTLNPCQRNARAHRSSEGEEEGPRPPRVAPVREPEPLNDFERARLENIRRNQEALAGALPPKTHAARKCRAWVPCAQACTHAPAPRGRSLAPSCL
jgi:hypothetical protein